MVARENEIHKWRLIDYFDVWFNENDGYWVNEQTEVMNDIVMTDDAENKDIFDFLKDSVGYFGPEAKYEDMHFDGDYWQIEMWTERDGYTYPLCRLERVV